MGQRQKRHGWESLRWNSLQVTMAVGRKYCWGLLRCGLWRDPSLPPPNCHSPKASPSKPDQFKSSLNFSDTVPEGKTTTGLQDLALGHCEPCPPPPPYNCYWSLKSKLRLPSNPICLSLMSYLLSSKATLHPLKLRDWWQGEELNAIFQAWQWKTSETHGANSEHCGNGYTLININLWQGKARQEPVTGSAG